MPQLGQIVTGAELGYSFDKKMIWVACPNCGNERWVQTPSRDSLCLECFRKLILPKLNLRGREPKPFHLFTGTPQIGDIKFGGEIGKKDMNHRFVWLACLSCGKEKWVRLRNGKPTAPHCQFCATGRGETHPQWKGGQTIQDGYIVIYKPDHPYADCNGYVKRARLVLEEKLGHYLLPTEDSHHINGVKTDDRPENLEALSRSEHMRSHQVARGQSVST